MGPEEFADWAAGLVLAYQDSWDVDLAGAAQTAREIATRRLRDRFPGQPTHWAGYIHTGI